MRIRACAQTRQGQCEKNGSAACAQRKKMFMLEAACEGDMSSVSGAGAPVQEADCEHFLLLQAKPKKGKKSGGDAEVDLL